MVEYFFSDSFFVNVVFGFLVVIVFDEGNVFYIIGVGVVDEVGEVGFGVGVGGLFGMVGFMYYF